MAGEARAHQSKSQVNLSAMAAALALAAHVEQAIAAQQCAERADMAAISGASHAGNAVPADRSWEDAPGLGDRGQ
jgi:hypothetical protein